MHPLAEQALGMYEKHTGKKRINVEVQVMIDESANGYAGVYRGIIIDNDVEDVKRERAWIGVQELQGQYIVQKKFSSKALVKCGEIVYMMNPRQVLLEDNVMKANGRIPIQQLMLNNVKIDEKQLG
jgi:hypothetical protein